MGSGKPKDDIKKEAKEKKTEKKEEIRAKPVSKKIEGVRMIVRLAEADLDGTKRTVNALLKVRGIGQSLAAVITDMSGVDQKKMVGSLTDEEIKKIEDIIINLGKYNIPGFLLNRRNDPDSGENIHKISSELIFTKKSDIDSMRKMQCYKGVRHQLGLPVRGQRTRSSFRTGEKVGVVKKKEMPAARSKSEKK